VSEHELDFYFQKWRFTLDTGSFGTKEISFHLASELLLHVCKMLLLLVLVVLKGYLRSGNFGCTRLHLKFAFARVRRRISH